MKQDTLEGKAKTKNGVKRLCFSIVCILLEVIFILTIVTRLNEYAEITIQRRHIFHHRKHTNPQTAALRAYQELYLFLRK